MRRHATPPVSILDTHFGREKMPHRVIIGEPPEERNDDFVLRARRAVRSDPSDAPDEPVVVFFQRFDSEAVRARGSNSQALRAAQLTSRTALRSPSLDPQDALPSKVIVQRELTTIGEAKQLLHESWGVRSDDVDLVYCGRKLYPDDALLCDRGCIEGAIVYVKLRGGDDDEE